MCRFTMFRFHACFIIFISEVIISSYAFTCIHDEIIPLKTPSVYARSIKYEDIRDERDKDPSLFEPLEIFFYLDNFDPSVSRNVIFNIQSSFEKLRKYIAETFQVRKRNRPFLLQRSGCTRRWQSGRNKGKCSTFKGGPEFCDSEHVDYEISNRFLDKLEVYDFATARARYAAPSGPGVLGSNFIQFVTSQSTSFCEGSDIFAYGTHCKVHDMTNEPVAGILNLCPGYFTKKIYTFQHYYNILLHEMFHVLGFSTKMFEKYLPCQKGVYCNVPMNAIQEDSAGTPRMMYPRVVQSMQDHFNCSNPDFGAPMAVETEASNDTGGSYSSHWHPVLMYSSIMTPKFQEFDHIFVDNITLAAFASTGWYRVNFSSAQDFTFGKGQGCGFGMNETCEGPYLCDPSSEKTGCDLLHKTIGECTSLTPSHKCGVFEPYTKEDCESTIERQFGLDFYALGYLRKCLVIEGENETSTCTPVKCKSDDSYSILINGTWYPCNSSDKITVENATSIFCPDNLLFCPHSATSHTDVVKYDFCPVDTPFFVFIRINFRLPSLKDLNVHRSFKNFKVTILRKLAERIKIPVNYISNASLNVFKKVNIELTICPPPSISNTELIRITDQTQAFLDGGNFHEILKGSTDLIMSSSDISIDPDYNLAFSDYEGFRTLLAFPVVCAIFLIVTFIASLVRILFLQKGKRRRITETVSEGQLQDGDTRS